jgi:DNA polymerase I-like protein with 3'-5' exonuclease and polymerase domains
MSKLNIQALPVDAELLECLEPAPGHSLVYTDFSALEPHVLTEFSQDKRMLDLYGPNASRYNDIYLYVGSYIDLFRDAIRTFYDPANPTKESVDLAKEHCAQIRKVIKIVVLGSSYGMGAKKLQEGINLAGFDLSFAQAKGISKDYWDFFSGIKRFEQQLIHQYQRNKGFIINGRGRPLAIHPDYTKDIVNRFVQSTGHDILMHYVYLLNNRRKVEGLKMRPWFVDEHDATIAEVADDQAEYVAQVFKETFDELNEKLQWGVKFVGKIRIGKSLAIKCD